ncbi:MAG TPA: SDR family NAD(P)-dependent oxidoreductase [Nitrospiraceae bacterium]|nr:SDR family NAD(P)-dependent oxidoreductase [Nitrospiraceae bacterium]
MHTTFEANKRWSLTSKSHRVLRRQSWLGIIWLLCVVTQVGCAHHERIQDKVVVITGASSGFGKGVAQKLSAQGAHVVLAARRTELIEELAREVGGQALAVTTDVSKASDVERLTQAAISKFGRIDVWINNAGVGTFGRFEEIPLADQVRLVNTNLIGVIHGSHFAMRQFRNQGHGTLINVASISGKIGTPYYASYSATKFGIVGLGQALNQELRLNDLDENIHVSTINPMPFDTPFWEHAANYTGHSPRAYPMNEAEPVIDAIVDATTNPKKEVTVAFAGKWSVFFHRMMPDTSENMFGSTVHKALIKDAPPTAPPTQGSLYEPMPTGTGVSGGVIERMEEEDRR